MEELERYGLPTDGQDDAQRLEWLLRHLEGNHAATLTFQEYTNKLLRARLARFCPGCADPQHQQHIFACPNLDEHGKLRNDGDYGTH